MAINVDIQPAVPVVNDDTKDAVVIDSLTKIFKKSRPLLRWHKKNAEQKEEKREVRAVDNVTITIKRREIVGILGSNGSGKSTLIRILSTLLIPDSGHVSIFGYDVVKNDRTVQRLINRVSVEASFFKKLSPMENLIYAARLYNMPGDEARLEIRRILARLGIKPDRIVALGDALALKRAVTGIMGRSEMVTMHEVFMHYTAAHLITETDIERYGSWEKAFEAFEAQREDEEE